jgi:translation initiation factor 3 subunit L
MSDAQRTIDFHLPDAIKDFIFDLHSASRRSLNLSEVESQYDVKFREVTEKYFPNSPWPEPSAIAIECGDDGVFLLFYRFFFFFLPFYLFNLL